jgi:hypothetical protein
VRLDHLLSKEHHENASRIGWGVSQVESAPVVGVGWVQYNEPTANTLLGFEATPFFGVVASSWWWGVVFELWIVVASI